MSGMLITTSCVTRARASQHFALVRVCIFSSCYLRSIILQEFRISQRSLVLASSLLRRDDRINQ